MRLGYALGICAMVVSATLASSDARAAVVVSTNEAVFTATLQSPTQQTFDGPTTIIDENTPAVAYGIGFKVTGTSSFDDLTVGGGRIHYGVGNTSYSTITMDFGGVAINSFGGNFVGAATSAGTTITASNGDSVVLSTFLPNPGTGFLGFTSTSSFTSITLTSSNGGLEIADINDVVYGNTVPEPTMLGAVGLATVATLRRRVRR